MKIAIMGYVGSGKSVLARNLSNILSIPKIELDDIAFDKQWKPIDRNQILPEIRLFMEQDCWIIDGNFDDLLQKERLQLADQIIFVMLPRVQCLIRALKRTKDRAAAGYVNDINPWFIRFCLFDCRNRRRNLEYRRISREYRDKLLILRSQRAIDNYLAQFDTKTLY